MAEWSLLGRNYLGTAAVCMCGLAGGVRGGWRGAGVVFCEEGFVIS